MRYGGLLFKEEKSSKGLLSFTKVVFFWSDFYETWSSRKIGDTATGLYFPVLPSCRRRCKNHDDVMMGSSGISQD